MAVNKWEPVRREEYIIKNNVRLATSFLKHLPRNISVILTIFDDV